MQPATSEGAKRFQAILGQDYAVLEFEESTHTSAEAAAAIGCDVARIAKSLIFKAADGTPVLVVASGTNRVSEKKLVALLGQKISRADADFVLRQTGFMVGGVPPLGHATPPATFLDHDLKRFPTIWAAAGSPNAVFELTPDSLAQLTGAPFADIAR